MTRVALRRNLETMLQRGQDSPLLRFSLGSECLKEGDVVAAIGHLREALERRVPDADAGIGTTDLHLAELRVVDSAPGSRQPALVVLGVPAVDLLGVGPVDAGIAVDESLRAR